jgi:hypothetical protein
VDALLEAAAHGRVERPGEVSGRQQQHTVVVVAEALELGLKLGLDAVRELVGAAAGAATFAAGAQRVDLVDEDDGGLLFAGELEEAADEAVLGRQGLMLADKDLIR